MEEPKNSSKKVEKPHKKALSNGFKAKEVNGQRRYNKKTGKEQEKASKISWEDVPKKASVKLGKKLKTALKKKKIGNLKSHKPGKKLMRDKKVKLVKRHNK